MQTAVRRCWRAPAGALRHCDRAVSQRVQRLPALAAHHSTTSRNHSSVSSCFKSVWQRKLPCASHKVYALATSVAILHRQQVRFDPLLTYARTHARTDARTDVRTYYTCNNLSNLCRTELILCSFESSSKVLQPLLF